MKLQMRKTEDIENILWAMQVLIQATTTLSDSNTSTAYRNSFNQGFEAAWQRLKTLFEVKPSATKMWLPEEIRHLLETVQPRLSASVNKSAGGDDDQGYYQGFEAARWCMATSFGLSLLPPGSNAWPMKSEAPADSPLWFHEDVQNILLAVETVIQVTTTASENLVRPIGYNEGLEAALHCVAQLFGISLISRTSAFTSKSAAGFWLLKDIEHKLYLASQTVLTAASTPGADQLQDGSYEQGCKDALESMAISFGVRLPRSAV